MVSISPVYQFLRQWFMVNIIISESCFSTLYVVLTSSLVSNLLMEEMMPDFLFHQSPFRYYKQLDVLSIDFVFIT